MIYNIKRKVIKGFGRGKNLGFPTINVRSYKYDHNNINNGVWATLVKIDNQQLPAITHVGRPISFNDSHPGIETHILNFEKNLYGKTIEIKFIKWIRNTNNFPDKKDLINQIVKDIKITKVALDDINK